MNWLKERLKEKSTQTAIVSLGAIILSKTGLELDIIAGIHNLVIAMLIASASTEG